MHYNTFRQTGAEHLLWAPPTILGPREMAGNKMDNVPVLMLLIPGGELEPARMGSQILQAVCSTQPSLEIKLYELTIK